MSESRGICHAGWKVARVRNEESSTATKETKWLVRTAVIALVAALCAGCATRPPATAFDRPVTHALSSTEPTPLETALAPLEKQHPDESAVRLLPTGSDARGA